MSLIDSLSSKPRWQNRRPEIRLAAVAELDDPGILSRIVQEDEDPAVRAAALERIDDDDLLDRLIAQPGLEQALRDQARRRRLQRILPQPSDLARLDDPDRLAQIARLAPDAEVMEAAIARLKDEGVRADLALTHPVARARLCAVEGIADSAVLQSVMQQARHKDKAVFRHCRERLDALHTAEREAEARREQLERIVADAQALREAPDVSDFVARYRGLCERWERLGEHAEADLAERVSADLDVCARRIEQREEASRAEAARAAEVLAARERFGDLQRRLDDLGSTAADEGAEARLREIDRIEEEWVLTQQRAAPGDEAVAAFRAALNTRRGQLRAQQSVAEHAATLTALAESAARAGQLDYTRLQEWLAQAKGVEARLAWPEDAAQVPPELRGLREGREAVLRRIEELGERQAQTVEKVDAALAHFREELATNHYRNADRALDRLRNLLRQLPKKRQARYQNELKPLLVRLQEIHDWQGFAIEPKKRELVEQMQALVGSEADADALAARIRELQAQWKQLGPLAPSRDRALWKAFQAAANEAWAPCKQAFSQRAAQRREAYGQRMKVVEQLVAYEQQIAWPDLSARESERIPPDWKRVRQTLRAAREAFRELSPVDRKQERRSQKALDSVCDRIYGHLKAEYERNTAARQALVDEARALAGEADLKRAIDRAKAVQAEWKRTGPVPRAVDQKLWKALRKACDEVFGRLDERREERRVAAKAEDELRLQRKAEKVQRWENLLSRLRACALRPAEPAAAEALWAGTESLPRWIDAEALEAWWLSEAAAADEDACRVACISLEVLAGQPSPPEDREARMAYQMQRLVEGMGQQGVDRTEALREQVGRFAALRPSLPYVERFSASVRVLKGLPAEPGGSGAKAPAG